MIGLQSSLPLLAVWLGMPLFCASAVRALHRDQVLADRRPDFQQQPPFLPLRVRPGDTGEPVEFTTDDGLTLCGSYLPAGRPSRPG